MCVCVCVCVCVCLCVIYVSALKIYEGAMKYCKDTLCLYVISAGNIHLCIETFLLPNSCILEMLHADCLVH